VKPNGHNDENISHYSRFIPERVAETSQILLRDTYFYQNVIATRNAADVIMVSPLPSDRIPSHLTFSSNKNELF
jgi:hypothetical protein